MNDRIEGLQAVPSVYRGIIHFHTRYSFDSLASLRSVRGAIRRLGLNFAICTDHDSIEGSRRLAGLCLGDRKEDDAFLEIPLAAEYKTELGDVIACFIQKEIAAREFRSLCEEVRSQHGLILLPHPCSHHTEVETLVPEVDMIETFNARHAAERDEAALVLAKRFGIPAFFGSDAHSPHGLGSVIVEIESRGMSLRDAMLSGTMRMAKSTRIPRSEVYRSQIVKGLKTRRPRIVIMNLIGLAKHVLARFR